MCTAASQTSDVWKLFLWSDPTGLRKAFFFFHFLVPWLWTDCHFLLVKNNICGASLVAQWLRVCLPMQGTRVRALVWEDPTCRGATRPVSHSYWACASGARAPQRERPRQWEVHAPWWRVAPACRNWRKPSHRNKDPTQPNINKLKKKYMQNYNF